MLHNILGWEFLLVAANEAGLLKWVVVVEEEDTEEGVFEVVEEVEDGGGTGPV